MKSNRRVLLVVTLLMTLSVLTWESALCRQGDADASGTIERVVNGDQEIMVEGKTANGRLWLGCTLFPGTDQEQDLEAVESRDNCLFWCSGEFQKKFKIPSFLRRLLQDPGRFGEEVARGEADYSHVPYAAALWRWKVDRAECVNGENAGPCEWCRENGYHLEDRVDIGRGTWTLNEDGANREELRRGQWEAESREDRQNPEVSFSKRLGIEIAPGDYEGDDCIRVVEVIGDSKADGAGIQSGDLILRVDILDSDGELIEKVIPTSQREFDLLNPREGSTICVKLVGSRMQNGEWENIDGRPCIRF